MSATFYTMFFFEPKPPVIARVCVNLSCHLRGAQEILHTLEEAAKQQHDAFEVEEVMCLGLCEQAPALLVNEEAVGQVSAEEALAKGTGLRDNHQWLRIVQRYDPPTARNVKHGTNLSAAHT